MLSFSINKLSPITYSLGKKLITGIQLGLLRDSCLLNGFDGDVGIITTTALYTFPDTVIAFSNLVLHFIADTKIAKATCCIFVLCIFYIYNAVQVNLPQSER